MGHMALVLSAFVAYFVLGSSVSKNVKGSNSIVLSNGVPLTFRDKTALPILKKWASDIDKASYSVSHSVAVGRESMVVQNVNSGVWTVEAYHDYQRMAASTGNVDSARLLFEYSIAPSIYGYEASKKTQSEDEKLLTSFRYAILKCNLKQFKRLFKRIETHIWLVRLSVYSTTVADTGADGSTLLMAAAYVGCVDIVSMLLDIGTSDPSFDVDEEGSNGVTALMIAAAAISSSPNAPGQQCIHCDIIQLLVDKGRADVNHKHKFAGTTALHFAAEMDRYQSISTLCRLGAEASSKTATGSTLIHTAAHSGAGMETFVALINDCKVDVNDLMNADTTPLYLAAHHGHVKSVQALIELGADINFAMPRVASRGTAEISTVSSATEESFGSYSINSEPGNGATALHSASEEGHAEVVRVLLEHGADINSLAMGVTPLHLAVQYHEVEVVRVLLAHGAELNKKSYTDQATPLYYAAGSNDLVCAKLLLAAGSNVTEVQRAGGFPLLYAAMNGYLEMVKLLIEYGADVDQQTPTGLTAWTTALANNHNLVFRRLLCPEFPCDATTLLARIGTLNANKQNLIHMLVGMNPFNNKLAVWMLEQLSIRKDPQFVRLLLSTYDSNGALPVHLATRVGTLSAMQWLVQLTTMLDPSGEKIEKEMGEMMNRRMLTLDSNELGSTALYNVVINEALSPNDKKEYILYLLQHGCDPNAVVASSASPPASSTSSLSAPVSRSSQSQKIRKATPLLAAIDRNDFAAVQSLLVGAPGISEHMEIHPDGAADSIAASGPRAGLMNRADPNVGIPGAGLLASPILFAVAQGKAAIVRELLTHGSNCNIIVQTSSQAGSVSPGAVGETLVEISRRKRDFDTMKVLSLFEVCDSDFIRSSLQV